MTIKVRYNFIAAPPDDEVVEDFYVHQGERPLQGLGEYLIGSSRLRDAGRISRRSEISSHSLSPQ